MELQLTNASHQMEQPQGTCRTQLSVAGEVTLPGSLREAARVLHADAMAVAESAEALQDRVSVSGRVVFRVLYAQGDPVRLDSIEASADFTHLCELPGVSPRAQVDAQTQVEHVEASVSGGRMTMRAVVRMDARAMSCAPVEVLTGVQGKTAQTSASQIRLRRTAARGSADVLLREEFPLPADLMIRQTLMARAIAGQPDASGGQGRIGLNGEVVLEAVHASDLPGKPIVTTRHTLPVQQAVDVTGEEGDRLDGRITVKDVAVASQDFGEGEHTLRAEVLLGLTAFADKEENVAVLRDAYTTSGDDLRLEHASVPVRVGDNRMHAAESVKLPLLLPDHAPKLRTALAAFATPVMTAADMQGQRLMTEGVLEANLIYLPDSGDTPVSVRLETPFRTSFAAAADREDLITLTASDVEAVPVTSDRIELRCVLHLAVDGVQTETADLVTRAASVPAEAPVEDMVLYFVQPGETAWDIARRYRVPENSLRTLNPELTGEPKTGQGVLVWRRSARE